MLLGEAVLENLSWLCNVSTKPRPGLGFSCKIKRLGGGAGLGRGAGIFKPPLFIGWLPPIVKPAVGQYNILPGEAPWLAKNCRQLEQGCFSGAAEV